MKRFEILEHRADLKMKVFGRKKQELFSNALLGMEAGLRPDLPPSPKLRRASKNIKVESPDLNALLVDFLSEALYLIQTNKETYNDVKFKKFTDVELEAELVGNQVESFGEEIKAVTYHGLDIHQRKDGLWESVVLFDI